MDCNTNKVRSTRRKTTEDVSLEIHNLTNGKFSVVGEYKNNKTPIEIKCNECCNVFEKMTNRFLNNPLCPFCSDRTHYTNETIAWKVKNITNQEYEIVSDFKAVKFKADFLHKECGEISTITVSDFLTGASRCKVCGFKNRTNGATKSQIQFKKELERKFSGKIVALEKYINSKEKIKFKCLEHNEEFLTSPGAILNKLQGCKICGKKSHISKSRKFSIEDVELFLSETNLRLISNDYKTTTQPLKFVCLECDREFTSCFHTIKRSNMKRCKGCSITETNSLPHEVIERYIEEETSAKWIGGEYVKNTSKLKLRCECGVEFTTNWLKITQNNKTRCRKCNGKVSNAEYKTAAFLEKEKIPFKSEQTFEDLRNYLGSYYRFDFSILDSNSDIKLLIELDGGQHFKPIDFWGGEEGFARTKENDKIKEEYCRKNNIPLLRIPYWDFDKIEEILKLKLKSAN